MTDNLLFFILPNNRLGVIDTIIGEKVNNMYSNLSVEDSIKNSNNNIHIHKNYISFFDNSYLYTIDLKENNITIGYQYKNNITSINILNSLGKKNIINDNQKHYKINIGNF